MGPRYLQRANAITQGLDSGDWPELYVLAAALRCRIDVYWPLEQEALWQRYVRPTPEQHKLPRWCLLREAPSWTPLVGAVADHEQLSDELATNAALRIPDGPNALFDALATLSHWRPLPNRSALSAAQLRRLAADGLRLQGRTPYAQRDTLLMQMLALMPESSLSDDHRQTSARRC